MTAAPTDAKDPRKARLAEGGGRVVAFSVSYEPDNLLERGLGLLRPGALAGDIDAAVREGLDYPHHTGHGVGVAPHEEPRIVPGGETVIEPGMVVALEPGSYPGPWGMRVERVALVTMPTRPSLEASAA